MKHAFQLPARPLVAIAALAMIAAYANGFRGTFVMDDVSEIVENEAIRTLWPPWVPMFEGGMLAHRPLPYFTFALNHAIHGLAVPGYHVVNIGLHCLNGLLVALIVTHVLRLAGWRQQPRIPAEWVGAATACLWLVHPLQTQAVTYIYQRIEIMGTTAIFMTVACFLLGETSRHRTAWRGLAVCSCLLGSFCKETVIAAPVLVLLCDWIVLRTKPQDLVTKRLPLYAGLFACWPLVVAIVRLQADRYPESQGLGYGPLAYLANQPAVVVWYLRLAVWPTKLCFDYGWPVYRTWHLLAPWCVLVGTALAMATYFGIRRRLAALPALMFFTLLAPTSSLIPCNELCTEHRMYAPLAPLCAVLAFAIARWLERLAGSLEGLRQPSWRALAFGLVIAALVVPLAAVTNARNACYDSRLALRIDTVLKATSNPRAHRMLACELAILGRPKDALPFLRNAIELQPRYPLAYATLGQVFEMLGEKEQAVNAYARAAELNPANAAVKSRLQVLKAATNGPPTAESAPP